MFELLDTVRTAVDAVSGIEYTSDNLYDEITAYSAFIIDENIEVELEKIAINGQIYNAIMRADFYLHVIYANYTKTQLQTLFENVIKAIAATASSSGFKYIKVINIKQMTPFQIGSTKTRTIFGTIEFYTQENWV